MRIYGTWRWLLVGAPLLMVVMVVQMAAAQDATPAPTAETPAQTAVPAPAPQATDPTPAPQAATTPASQDAAPADATPQVAAPQAAPQIEPAAATPTATPQVTAAAPQAIMTAAAAKPEKKGKEKKVEYTGPNTVIVLPATPMLDEEGKQRLDPDGQPMFNPPVKQQRDKKGHPLFDASGKPVFQTATELGYDDRGKKLHAVKEKVPKMTPVNISRGTFTIDGMIGKAELNYNIPDFKYIYLYAPGIGTLVVSNEPFPGAKEEKNAFTDKTLTVTTTDHKLQLASDQRLLGKKPESAFVLLDRNFRLPSKYPVVGYGAVIKAPYMWPGGRPNEALAGAFVAPPPIPVNLEPVLLLPPCPPGQMRKPSPPVLPGEEAPAQPCVLIPKGVITVSGPGTKSAVATPAAQPAPDAQPATPVATPGSASPQ